MTVEMPVRADDVLASPTLAEFLASAGTLTHADRVTLVEQALVLLEQNYVHLPLKVAMHAVNPVQRLRVMQARLRREDDAEMPPEWRFHADMSRVFASVRDLHTNYSLPRPFADAFAFLPFTIEKYRDVDGEHYVVTVVVHGFEVEGFEAGVEVTHWNGTPVERAVALNAARLAGSNEAASLARGLDALTLRPLRSNLPPDEDWVDITYRAADGSRRTLRHPWRVGGTPQATTDADASTPVSAALGVDVDSEDRTRAKKLLFRPDVLEAEGGLSGATLAQPAGLADVDVATTMPGVFRARVVSTSTGEFGHLRIFTFMVDDAIAFRDEFVRLLSLLPPDGVVLDVRDNGGGLIYAAEFILQTLTPRSVEPEPVQFLTTPLNAAICRRHGPGDPIVDLSPWLPSLEQAVEIGATFSAAFPISPVEGANALGQTFQGPVVLVTDARCYSATDIFTAGFQDHRIGPVLGVDPNTGAGGANVWPQGLLQRLLAEPAPVDTRSPYEPLPRGAGMRVAIRRTLRVGTRAGTPVEDLGVEPDHRHALTRRDVLEDNQDLLEAAGRLLASMPVRRLDVSTSATTGSLLLELDVAGIDRVDVEADGRPRTSVDVIEGTQHVEVSGPMPARLRLQGWAGGELVAARRVTV